jgi:hypothetical protein
MRLDAGIIDPKSLYNFLIVIYFWIVGMGGV